MNKTLIVTPGNDLDSILASSLILISPRYKNADMAYVFPSVKDREGGLKSILSAITREHPDNVFIVDYPVSLEVYTSIRERCRNVCVFDHHSESIATKKAVKDFIGDARQNANSIEIASSWFGLSFDNVKLASLLTETGEQNGTHILAKAIKKFVFEAKIPSQRIIKAAELLTAENSVWEESIYGNIQNALIDMQQEREYVQQAIKDRMVSINVAGFECGVVAGSLDHAQLYLTYSSRNSVIVYEMTHNGFNIKTRSTNGSALLIAQKLGASGGHLDASYAEPSFELFSRIVLGVKPTVIQTAAPIVTTARSRKTTPSDTIVQEVVSSIFKNKVDVPMQLIIDSCPRHRAIMKAIDKKKDKNAIVRCLYVVAVLQHEGNDGLAASTVHGFVEKHMDEILTYGGKQLKSDSLIKLAKKMLPGGKLDYLSQS